MARNISMRESPSKVANETVDKHRVYDTVLMWFRRAEEKQRAAGEMVGLSTFMVEWFVRKRLGEEPAKHVDARISELVSMNPPVIRAVGRRLNPRTHVWVRNYVLTGAESALM